MPRRGRAPKGTLQLPGSWPFNFISGERPDDASRVAGDHDVRWNVVDPDQGRDGHRQTSPMTCAGLPITRARDGASRTTTAPGSTNAPAPIRVPLRIGAFGPIHRASRNWGVCFAETISQLVGPATPPFHGSYAHHPDYPRLAFVVRHGAVYQCPEGAFQLQTERRPLV